MSHTIIKVLELLDKTTDTTPNLTVELKYDVAQTLALIAIAQELEKLNELKLRELKIMERVK